MKKVTKLIVLALCVVMSIVVFSGCEKTGEGGSTAGATATPTPTATASEKTLYMKSGDVYRYLVWNFTTDHDMLDEDGLRGELIRERYNDMREKYGIDIQFVVPPADWLNGTLESAYSGSPITDVMHGGGPFTIFGMYNYNNIPGSTILPLDAYGDAATFSDPEYWNVKIQNENGYFDGHLYFAVPNDFGWALVSLNQVTFFNKDLVKSKGIEPETMYQWSKNGEWTWDKLEQVAIATTDESQGTYGLLAGENYCLMFSLIAGNGGDYIAKREVNGQMIDRFVGNEEPAIEAWDFFVKLSTEHNAVLQYKGVHEINDFSSGKVAMMMTYVNRVADVSKNVNGEFEYGLIMPVKGPRATDYISDVNWFGPLAMMANIENPEGTAQFMEEFFAPAYGATSKENIDLIWAELAPMTCDEESIQTCIDLIEKTSAKSYMLYASAQLWSTNAVNQMISKETTPKQYYESVVDLINAQIDKALGINN